MVRHALTKPPSFRANEPGTVIQATQSACNEWINCVSSAHPELKTYAINAATQAAKQALQEYNSHGMHFQAVFANGWKQQLKLFYSHGGIVSHADKQPLLVITCQTLATQMTIDMLSSSRRYVETDLAEKDALELIQMVLNEAVGGDLQVASKVPNLIQHIKTHKQHKPSGMEYRPTTNSRNAGCFTHAKIFYQILKLFENWAKTQGSYLCVESTTEFISKLPKKLKRAASADVRGFFTEITHQSIIKNVSSMSEELFKKKPGMHIHATEFSTRWCNGQANDANPNSYNHCKLIKLLNAILETDYTKAGDKIYMAVEGVPMGAPFSSMLSNLTMWQVERVAIPILRHAHKLFNLGKFIYLRYADDAFFTSPRGIFNSVFKPALETIGCQYEMEEGENEFTKGIPFLEARITLKQNGTVTTKHYSKSTEINSETPKLPARGGAMPMTVYTQAVSTYCRTVYITSTSFIDYIQETSELYNTEKHPRYSIHSIAKIAAATLTKPKKCRYGRIVSVWKLQRAIKRNILLSQHHAIGSPEWQQGKQEALRNILSCIQPW